MESYIILESIVLLNTAVLILHCEVSHCHEGGTGFLFPETEFLLNELFER
jgi:hypothetical protein